MSNEYKDPRVARQERDWSNGSTYNYPRVPDSIQPKPETAQADREYRDPFRARQDRLGSRR